MDDLDNQYAVTLSQVVTILSKCQAVKLLRKLTADMVVLSNSPVCSTAAVQSSLQTLTNNILV